MKNVIHSFFQQQEGLKFVHDESVLLNLENTLDRWILSFTQSLVLFVKQEMAGKFRSENTNGRKCYVCHGECCGSTEVGWEDSSFKPLTFLVG